MEVMIEKLNEVMETENINEKVLESLTRKNIYSDFVRGRYTDKDLTDAASVLGTTVETLCGIEVTHTKCSLGIDLTGEIKKYGFTITSFCEYIDIAPSLISYYQNGKAKPTKKSLAKLSYGLNCSVEYLLGNTHDRGHCQSQTKYHSKKTTEITSKIKDVIKSGSLSPNKVAKKIGIPVVILKKLMVSGGSIPNSALRNFCNIYEISPETIIKTDKNICKDKPVQCTKSSNKNDIKEEEVRDTSLDDLLEVDKRQREMKRIADDLAKENASHQTGRLEVDKKVTKLSMPTDDGLISLNQLGAIVSILSRKPELISLFVEISNLKDDDYSHIKDHIEWLLGTINKSEE